MIEEKVLIKQKLVCPRCGLVLRVSRKGLHHICDDGWSLSFTLSEYADFVETVKIATEVGIPDMWDKIISEGLNASDVHI